MRLLGLTALLAGLATVFISVVPGLRFAYRSPLAHVAIETAVLLVAGSAALLFAGRALRTRSRNDVLVAASLTLIAVTSLLFSLVPALTPAAPDRVSTWAPVAGRFIGAVGFAGAALLPQRNVKRPRLWLALALGGVAATVTTIGMTVTLVGSGLPPGIDPGLSPESASRPRIVGHPAILLIQALTVAIYGGATIGFARRAGADPLMASLATAALLSAFARLNYFLFPSLYSEWVYTGDVLRLLAYLTLLVGLAREVLDYQRSAANAALLEERRRIARELHDGLAQELAYIRAESRRLVRAAENPAAGRISAAATRALDESRTAISALTQPLDESLPSALRRAAASVAEPAGARVAIVGDLTDAVPYETRHALVRIVREATSNAVRHGNARSVRVSLDSGPPRRLRIEDDGQGFDPGGQLRPDAFGLTSMRERAEGLGGELEISSAPGAGTVVEVTLP